jgi:hypothetical protein
MQVNCSLCTYTTEIDETLLPSGGMEGLCPSCRASIPLGSWQSEKPPVQALPAEELPPGPVAEVDYALPDEGRVSLINIIALITLVDSTLSLIGRVPGLADVLGGGTGLTFHQQAKYFYDTLMAAGFFISVFGLMARKNWARLLIIWLFGLSLAEGLYMQLYQYFAITELETNLHEGFPELKRQQYAKLLGCAVYAFFIYKLMTRTIRARFR